MNRLPKSNGPTHISTANWWVRVQSILWITITLIGAVSPIDIRGPSFRLSEWSNIVPLPSDVGQIAYELVVNKLNNPGKLPGLISSWSDVCSSVTATNRELTQRVICALKRRSCTDSTEKKARLALLSEVNPICEQLKSTTANVSELYHLYSSLESAYYDYNLTATNILEDAHLGSLKSLMVSSQPLFHKWLGFNYKEMYWNPWKEKDRRRKEIQPGLVTLEQEIQRLKIINQIIHEIRDNLEDLAITLVRKDIAHGIGSFPMRYYNLAKRSLKRLFESGSCQENLLKVSKKWY